MNERERRRRQRERIRRRRRRIRAAAAVIVIAVITVTAVVCVKHFHPGKQLQNGGDGGDFIVVNEQQEQPVISEGETSAISRESAAAAEETAIGTEKLEAAAPVPEGTEEPEADSYLELTESQKHTGDLILVSSSYAYDFEINSSVVQLVNIKESQSWNYPVAKEEFMLSKKALKALDAMIHDCDQTMGTNETGVSSAWRSLEYQQQVWDETADEYGSDYAASYVARPGYSEHHTGLSVDLGIFYDDGSEGQFSGSGNASWMAENCYKYGFIRRYAEDKVEITGIENEAWHFRYVGVPHATYMHENNLCLEEYLDYLREHTSEEEPLEITYGYDACSVYYTSADRIKRPEHRCEVSGDNRGGCIITVTKH